MFSRSKTLSVLVLFCLLTGLLAGCTAFSGSGGTVTIAVVESAPLLPNGEVNPQSIYAGVKLAVDQINAQGGAGGQKIVVKPYVDDGTPEQAVAQAEEIVASNAVAVIGHSLLETSGAAAEIYNAAKLPVIGVIPANQTLASEYEYYFNLSYTANQEGAYLANYVIKVLDIHKSAGADKTRNRATIIYTNDEYGLTLHDQFSNTFRGLGGKVVDSWLVSKVESSIDQIATRLASLNSETQNPGTIFIATDEATAANLLIKMRRKGLNYSVIGASNMAGATFNQIIAEQSEEKAQSGYFTNGVIATRSLIYDAANEQAGIFFDDYQAQYPNHEPGDLPSNGYDSALTLFSVIQASQPNATNSTAGREQIYNALVAMDNPNLSVPGITGRVYFDPARKTVRGPHFGIYQNGQLVSASTQFEPMTNPEQADDGNVITVNGENVFMVNIVYAGIDVLSISDIDIKTSTYKMDFYLWFRYPAELAELGLEPENFVFINAQEIEGGDDAPISVIPPSGSSNLTTVTYRITGTFKNQFSFYEYPFDVQSLPIQFRNEQATTSSIKYAVDRIGMQYPNDAALQSHFKNAGVFADLHGWNDRSAHAEQVTFSTSSTLGDPSNFDGSATTDFSLIRLTVEIKRDSLQYIVKSLLPLLITLLLAYITFFLPIGHEERLTVGSTALLTTAFFHITLADALPEIGYTVAMEFLFYASYAVSALIVLLETLSIRLEKSAEKRRGKPKQVIENKREQLNAFGRVAYPVILMVAIVAGGLVYGEIIHLGPESELAIKSPVRPFVVKVDQETLEAEQTPLAGQGGGNDPVVLELATWRPEDEAYFSDILAEFNAYARDTLKREISVRYAPVMSTNYDTILAKRLDKGEGPDLFYVRPFSVDGNRVRSLEPLSAMELAQNYDSSKSLPWQDANGTYYALPFAGVVQGVYYNKELFAQYGYTNPPQTWDELLTIARVIYQESDGRIVPIANTFNQNEDSEMFQGILANFVGGQTGRADFTRTENSLCFTHPRIVNAFDAVDDLKPYLYLPENKEDRRSDKGKELFFNGRAAMLFGGSWDVKNFSDRNLPFEWSVFAVPAPTGDPVVIFHPDSGIGINRNSTHKAEARLFLEWLRSDAGVAAVVKHLPGFYPLRNNATGENDNIHAQEFLQLTSDYATDARWAETEISDFLPKASDLIRSVLYDLAYTDLQPREAARRLQSGLGEWYAPAQTCK